MPESKVQGFVADKFSAVRDAFQENLASGADVGASCCATLQGETVCIAGDHADLGAFNPNEVRRSHLCRESPADAPGRRRAR